MQKQRTESSLVFVGQALIISGIVYAAWHLGGVTTPSLFFVSLLSLAVLAIASVVMILRGRHSAASFVLPMLACLFLGYSVLHGTLGGAKLSKQLAEPTVAAIDQAITELDPGAIDAAEALSVSKVGHRSQSAMVPFASGIAFLIGASVFFIERRSRIVFAVSIIGNSMLLVCWGFIQRAGDNEFILPAVTHDVDTVPFASFIYKNAGAAALIPALAIVVVAFMKGKTFNWNSSSMESSERRPSYGSTSRFFDVSNLVLISTGLFLVAGLVISLCRGAWLSAIVAVAVAFVLDRRLKLTRASLPMIAIGAGVVVTLLLVLGGEKIALDRAGDVSAQRLASDQRWSHWPDGWDTAIAYFPFGSGLGTYRYATLPFQRQVHKSWFQYAHNQYLETFAETGIVGLALALVAIAWLGMHCVDLVRRGQDSSSRRWGLIALIVLASGCVQSLFDFVLIIPANMYLYAAVFGIAAACSGGPRSDINTASRWWHWAPNWKVSVVTVAATVVLVLVSARFASNERYAEKTMAQTRFDDLDGPPSEAEIRGAISHLNTAIDRHPTSWKLRRRRAAWEVVGMRSAIFKLAAESGEPVTWAATETRQLFTALQMGLPQQRNALVKDLQASPAVRQHLVAALRDLKEATLLEPCVPQNHVVVAFLSPLAEMPVDAFLPNIAMLSNNSPHLLYNVGLIAYMTNQPDMAVEHWHRCLDLHLQHIEPIFELSVKRFDNDIVASRIIPSQRMDLLIRMIDRVPVEQSRRRIDLSSELVSTVMDREDLEDSLRWSWIAKIHERVQRYDDACAAWGEAVAKGGRNLDYRYSLSVSLRRVGKTEEAIDQALLGSAIGSGDNRFDRFIKQCRLELTQKTSQVRSASRSTLGPHQAR